MTCVLISAQDAGGANAIAPVVERLLARGDVVHGLLSGPAKKILSLLDILYMDEELSDEALVRSLAMIKPDTFLAGTSTGETIDKRVLQHVRGRTPSVYVLDFWLNYGQRFSKTGKDLYYLPDYICVMDHAAEVKLIADGVPSERVRVTGNPHFEEWVRDIDAANENRNELLFVSQPISEIPPQSGLVSFGYDEKDVLQSLISVLARAAPSCRLKVRLHPREQRNKFNEFRGDRVTIAGDEPLVVALSRAGLVIGMFSPVLMQAAVAGKCVLSYQLGPLDKDPLPTNALGITRRIANEEELETALALYQNGVLRLDRKDPSAIWPPGAADRIVSLLDQVKPERGSSAW